MGDRTFVADEHATWEETFTVGTMPGAENYEPASAELDREEMIQRYKTRRLIINWSFPSGIVLAFLLTVAIAGMSAH